MLSKFVEKEVFWEVYLWKKAIVILMFRFLEAKLQGYFFTLEFMYYFDYFFVKMVG